MPKPLLFFVLMVCTAGALLSARWVGLRFDRKQVESLLVFSAFIYGILLYEDRKLAFAFGGVATLMTLGLLSVEQFVASSGLDVIVFLLGTFLVVGYLEQTLFFEHVVGRIVRLVGPRPRVLLTALMATAMVSSALVGEVAAILFMGGAMLHLAGRYKLSPTPFLMMLVFATNTGSAATAFGPVGVTIAPKSGLSVTDFFRWAAPVSATVLVLVYGICRWWFAADFRAFADAVKAGGAPVRDDVKGLDATPGGGPNALRGAAVLLSMTGLFVLHGRIERLLGLPPTPCSSARPWAWARSRCCSAAVTPAT